MKIPTFLIFGAQKCGTTSMYHYLNQHPDIFLPLMKEPEFFTFSPEETEVLSSFPKLKKYRISDYGKYISLFESAANESAIGEASPTYLYGKGAFKRIRKMFPEIKLIAIIRNPVKRAFSHFYHNIHRGIESLSSFESAIAAEPKRIKSGWPLYWHYINNGYYYKHLSNYYEEFPKENIRIIIFEEFIANPEQTLKQVCQFLGVDNNFTFDTKLRYAISGKPVMKSLTWLLFKPNPIKRSLKGHIPVGFARNLKFHYSKYLLKKPSLNPDLGKSVSEIFSTDIKNLSSLLDKDLSIWNNR